MEKKKNQSQVLPLEPVDHVSHQGIGDAGVGLLSQQDGLPQLIQDHGVPIHLLLPCLQLGGEICFRSISWIGIYSLVCNISTTFN